MIKIMFFCHGNICRSTMAEFVFKDLVNKRGLSDLFFIASSGTSREELGNPVHPGTRKMLNQHGINCDGKRAVQLKATDYRDFDYLIAMDQRNISNALSIVGQDKGHKLKRLMDYTKTPKDIADPWYTGDFVSTYNDVEKGCVDLLEVILADMGK